MSKSTPFSLRIFVADGDPDGLRLVERSNWIGKAIIFPRALYPSVRVREEFQQTGVYLLIGPREQGDGEMLYIGEGDPVRPRIEQHYAKKDFWTRAVFFVAGTGQLNKAHVQYLESKLIKQANASKRMPLDNVNSPAEPTLSEADRADMDVFLGNILGMLPVLGVDAFEQPVPKTYTGSPLLKCSGKGINATGRETAQGFVIYAGSFAARNQAPSIKYWPSVTEMRDKLLQNGVLEVDGSLLRFTQDYTLTSPSLASSIVLGRNSNGRIEWKDASGKTLRELQEEQASK
jgi:hypothetical protein